MGAVKLFEVVVMAVMLTGVLFVGVILPGCKGSSTPDPSPPEPSAIPAPEPLSPASAAPAPALADPEGAEEDPDAIEARRRLVRSIHADGPPWSGSGPWDERVLDAMRAVPRHRFMPSWVSIPDAYDDRPYPIGHGQTISQPTVVAIMTQALELRGGERILEIGTGSGYQAAVLAVLAKQVYSIEIVEELGQGAKKKLAELGYRNVEVRIGDGYLGWPEQAPFDRIILTAAPPELPEALVRQLAEWGIIVAPVGDREQRLLRWTKRGGRLEKEDLGAVRFVPMVKGQKP